MKNAKLVYVIAGLMAMSVPQLAKADDAKPATRPNREELREKFQNLSPEEREAKMKELREKNPDAAGNFEKRRADMAKELGLKPEELKNLSEEERRAKIKEAVEKKAAELEKKKADGTITDSEKEMLQRMEMRKKFTEGDRGEGRGPGRRPRPDADKSSEKSDK
jgi:hypothetical protein